MNWIKLVAEFNGIYNVAFQISKHYNLSKSEGTKNIELKSKKASKTTARRKKNAMPGIPLH